MPETTLWRQLQGTTSHMQTTSNYWKLSNTEESTLLAWILDMDKYGLPLQLPTVSYLAQLLLSACLSQPFYTITIRGHWINCFIKHHPELRLKYSRKYDYQCAKCKDSKLIKAWFAWVQETIKTYRIISKNIYNIDKTGFQIGVASTAKVIYGSKTK